ncbi:hypothetical protein SAMN05192566_0411 [Methylophilus rhizosphaerae]|uniref:Uncharacterized protein n=1 Tax=Methylophilus rhizosphaerae TaxID=492660 RepID=A0A1G8ZPP0_9PROT|nr:hypothetical protein SAMN05192566_0411 [Methylophilus rhizosphaerae]
MRIIPQLDAGFRPALRIGFGKEFIFLSQKLSQNSKIAVTKL